MKSYEIANRLQISQEQRNALFIVSFQKSWTMDPETFEEFKFNVFQTSDLALALELIESEYAELKSFNKITGQVFLKMKREY